jgi:phosphoribosylformylglycinamidine synthase
MIKIAIIQFPGSNCEAESIRAVRSAGMEAEEFLWNQDHNWLKNYDGFFIVGGFSYEDRARSGAIAAVDPLMKYIKLEAEKGKPVLGVCNGAQVLVETGMVPGLRDYTIGMGLSINKRVSKGRVLGSGFYNNWVHIRLDTPREGTAFTLHLKQGESIKIPVAHGEGRFVMETELLEEMISNNQTVFRYCDEHGRMSEDFPVNPNGSLYNLAAVCNVAGNVLAIMPHPERTRQGSAIFSSMREYIVQAKSVMLKTKSFLEYFPKSYIIQKYRPKQNSLQFIIELIITDNEAVTVQNTLQAQGTAVEVKRYTHFEIELEAGVDAEKIRQEIADSGELFNSNKERAVSMPFMEKGCREAAYLVCYREDIMGQSKKETLEKRFSIQGIKNITKSSIWHIFAKDDKIEAVEKKVLDTHILFNPYSQVCSFM